MSPLPGGALPTRRRVKMRGLGAELREMERTNPDVALAADDLDRVIGKIIGRSVGHIATPLEQKLAWRTNARQDVERARLAKKAREEEAERWIEAVKARKAGKR